MDGYYDEALSAERLRRCYEIAPPRIRRYLEAEIDHVAARLRPGDRVLELGCGYGRVLSRLAGVAGLAVGIDTSVASLRLARETLGRGPGVCLAAMDAARLAFDDRAFDVVACVQNGISAFHADMRELVGEAVRVARPGGTVLFSSYAEGIWKERLAWFRLQAAEGLVGEIDEERTGAGEITCRDGFTATTVDEARFRALADGLDVEALIVEVDGSSLFLELRVP